MCRCRRSCCSPCQAPAPHLQWWKDVVKQGGGRGGSAGTAAAAVGLITRTSPASPVAPPASTAGRGHGRTTPGVCSVLARIGLLLALLLGLHGGAAARLDRRLSEGSRHAGPRAHLLPFLLLGWHLLEGICMRRGHASVAAGAGGAASGPASHRTHSRAVFLWPRWDRHCKALAWRIRPPLRRLWRLLSTRRFCELLPFLLTICPRSNNGWQPPVHSLAINTVCASAPAGTAKA